MKNQMNRLFAITLCALMVGSLSGNAFAGNGKFAKNHPRRAEVLGRDHNIGNKIQSDKGHLGGHYNQLMAEDRSIHRQERRDAKINGGYITPGQQKQLNREENHLNRQIKNDSTGQ